MEQTTNRENKLPMERVLYEVKKVIVGQDHLLERMIVALLARGHILVEGVPGLAKTMAIKTLAEAIGGEFKRIQFTPDLVPADLVGTRIYNQKTGKFETSLGPVFTNLLLADEINRTPPKTQAALLEAMQEHHVTAAGVTYPLDEPFFVLATQNPIEQEGTYPLPEAQLDRFMLNLWVDYPTFEEEVAVVRNTTSSRNVHVNPVISKTELLMFQNLIRQVPVADNVIEYAVRLVAQTRPKSDAAPDYVRSYLSWGAGPRASQYLILGAKALALLEGRLTPLEADVKRMAVPVLRHRIFPNFNAEAEGVTGVEIIERLTK